MTVPEPLAVLRSSSLFSDFSEAALNTLLEYFDVMEGARGDRLYEQGDEAGGLYIVASGSVVATVRDAAGAERAVSSIAAPESFGELGLLLRGERQVAIEAADDVVLYELAFSSFRRLKREHPELCLMLIMAIVRRFGRVLDESRHLLQQLILGQMDSANGS